jgi:hypothetical protein
MDEGGGAGVEPLGVVDHEHQRRTAGSLGELGRYPAQQAQPVVGRADVESREQMGQRPERDRRRRRRGRGPFDGEVRP